MKTRIVTSIGTLNYRIIVSTVDCKFWVTL